ncbi:Uncharacterised protein [Mycobacterium tuberculosis]|uniref:Uncharacterized protein n=2 Tax=Mycobacterium tuberculosis TaxID=1773 RepID=A0A0T9DJN0_MYCTX|nr:Uncharacterised protein [Mycobacterium tuberculosis]CFE69313.1 Uncharacterised protein [Mycobacterium tuberculosis]CKS39572.1 Uncharacterised protein [Mycobacterium tuberculosis]COV52034.1 Uncharacterised protein [Mycobacterium tuberculosis]COW51484.1 Uncharacterised protein [Mycobacterium tuberculosis]
MAGTDPPSSTIVVGSMRWTWPILTMSRIRRSCSSSRCDTVAQRYMLGRTEGSMRSRVPAVSSRSNRSSVEVAAPMASRVAP